MTDIAVTTNTYLPADRPWLIGEAVGHQAPTLSTDFGVIDFSLFTSGVHYPDGFLPSGLVLGRVASGGRLGPYSGTTDEVQTVTEGGSGLTSFTLTYSGQTTASIPAASAASVVQSAIAALSNVGTGNVTVTGNTGGPYTVTFTGTLADTDVAQMTATPTGGTGTVTVATGTAGGADASSDGRQTAVGLLYNAVAVPIGAPQSAKVAVAYVRAFAAVSASRLPAGAGLDANAKADLKLIDFRA